MIALSFLLLMLAFRTVVIPAQAAVMNVLSIGAAYGVLTAIFQFGWLHSLIGLDGLGADRLLRAAVHVRDPVRALDGLRGVPRQPDRGARPRRRGQQELGRLGGLVTSARVITAAALIMVFVFGSFVLNGDPTVKQFGIGLAVAVILDATIVRCLLVPALMIQMGKANWYMPRWLERLVPHISIEGAEFFERRERQRAAEREREPALAGSAVAH